ncbi:MAG: molybdenum cofactor cytidylyltransferase [Dehalobacterium sp.]
MGKIKALVLAAGYSSRMKRNKMLLPFAGSTVIENTVQKFLQSQVDGVALVVGNEREKIQQVLASYPVRFIENPRFAQGMSSSVQEGIRILKEDAELEGIMIIPGDMPLIKKETINAILTEFNEKSSPIIIPVHHGKRGHPVLFAKSLFPQLMNVSGDVGAREVVRKNYEQCCFLEVDDQGILIDIDCPEEYARWSTLVKNRVNSKT